MREGKENYHERCSTNAANDARRAARRASAPGGARRAAEETPNRTAEHTEKDWQQVNQHKFPKPQPINSLLR